MSQELSIFSNPEFGSVRVVMQNGEPWFVALDVAKALGYADPSRAVVDHCRKSIKSTILVDNQYGKKTPRKLCANTVKKSIKSPNRVKRPLR